MTPSSLTAGMAKIADSVKKGVPMINVPDVGQVLDWYASIGFTETARGARQFCIRDLNGYQLYFIQSAEE
jgi:hypothetical protein